MINRNISAIINRAATDGMWTEEPTAHDSVTEDNRRCDPAGSCLACLPTRLFHIQLSAGVVVGVLPCHHKQTFCWKQTPVGIVCKTSRMQHGSVHISQEILALSRTSHFSLGSLSPDAVHSNIDCTWLLWIIRPWNILTVVCFQWSQYYRALWVGWTKLKL